MSARQFATFEVDDTLFGVEVQQVQEVLQFSEYTAVPLAPAAIGGLFNLRGQVIAAVDLRVRLGLDRHAMDGPVMNVILRREDEAVSLLVDRIGEVVELDEREFEPPPETLAGAARSLVLGTYKIGDRLMLVLDVDVAADAP